MSPFSVSIIGCGRIAFTFEEDTLRKKPASHYGAISSFPDRFFLQSVCDPDPDRLNFLASRHPDVKTYQNHQQMLKDQVPDVVVISAPTPFHTRIAEDALRAGVLAVVLEKPVSPSLKSARKLLALQKMTQIPILVFHERRYDPLYIWAKELIQSQIYGPVLNVSAHLSSASFPMGPLPHPFLSYGGGALVHDGTHMVDLFAYFWGPMKQVISRLRHEIPSAATETSINSLLFNDQDLPIHLCISGLGTYFHFELEIAFKSARIRIGNGIRELSVSSPSPYYTGFSSLLPQKFPQIPVGNPFINAYNNLYDAMSTGAPLTSTLRDGFQALETIYALYRSCRHEGKPISLPLSSDRHPYGGSSFFSNQ